MRKTCWKHVPDIHKVEEKTALVGPAGKELEDMVEYLIELNRKMILAMRKVDSQKEFLHKKIIEKYEQAETSSRRLKSLFFAKDGDQLNIYEKTDHFAKLQKESDRFFDL